MQIVMTLLSNYKDTALTTTPIDVFIFVFCLIGCGLTSYFLGHRAGIEGCLEYLADQGIISLEDVDDE